MAALFGDMLQAGIAALDITLDQQQTALLGRYHALLAKWNRRINLIGKASTEVIVERHFIDSLTLLPHLPHCCSLLDIGSGAGFPGLVVKTVRPDIRVTLVEPRHKRIAFLNQVVRTLGLAEVAIDSRFLQPSTLPGDLQQAFTAVTARGLSSFAAFLPLATACCAANGKIIAMKGPNGRQEFDHARATIANTPDHPQFIHYRLPFSGARRTLIVCAPP